MINVRSITACVFLCFMGILNCFGQETAENWTHLLSEGPVSVYYKYSICDPEIGYDNESVLLKITNASPQSVIAEWDREIYFDGICTTCDLGDEAHSIYELGPKGIAEGLCSINGDRRLKLFSKFTDNQYKLEQQTFTGFKLNDFRVRLADPLE